MKAVAEDPDVFRREGRVHNGKPYGSDTPRPRQRFTLVHFNDLKPGKARRYLIKGMIPRVGLTLVWGPPKCGKSFFTFDLMMHAALGWEYRGRRTHLGEVVYVALEGGDGMNARAEAFRQQHSLPDNSPARFHLIADAMELVSDHVALVAAIKDVMGEQHPVAVVIDTVNRSFSGSESSDEDMTAYIRAADAIGQAFKCGVILVHHCGHDSNRPRGHSPLLGAVDAQIAVTPDGADNIIATVERMKDGPEGDTVASRLEQAEVGADEDGDPITSCIVLPVDVEAIKPERKAARKPNDRQKRALKILTDLCIDGSELPATYGLPSDIRAVPLERWREALLSHGVIDRQGPNARADFRRLKDALVAAEWMGERDDYAWKV